MKVRASSASTGSVPGSIRASAFVLLTVIICCAQPGLAQDARFLDVSKWTGTVTITGFGAGAYTCGDVCSYNGNYNFTFDVTLYLDTIGPYLWNGSYVGNAVISEATHQGACTTTFEAAGAMKLPPGFPADTISCAFGIDPSTGVGDTGKYTLGLGASTVSGTETVEPCNSVPGSQTDVDAPSFYSGFANMIILIPLPDAGMVLSGSQYIPPKTHGYTGGLGYGSFVGFNVSWTFTPAVKPLELVVSLKGTTGGSQVSYDDWRPEADANESSSGNDLDIQAKLQHADGTPTMAKADSIKFELTEVSKLSGVSMNSPKSPANPAPPDLQFDPSTNTALDLHVADGFTTRSIATTNHTSVSDAEAILTSYDWGGYATLVVTAFVSGGQTVVGYLEGHKETQDIPIPKRDINSKIADVWKLHHNAAGLSDDDDSDPTPRGDGTVGDGLTLQEEYRGFSENQDHIDGDPEVKDLFIRNDVGESIDGGISLFKDVSGLKTHPDMSKDEMADDRVINVNHGSMAHAVDQHGIIIMRNPSASVGYSYASDPADSKKSKVGTPGQIARIFIQSKIDPSGAGTTTQHRLNVNLGGLPYINKLVAHEMLHACNVHHHGSGDGDSHDWAIYFPGNSQMTVAAPRVRDLTTGQWITVYREDGSDLVNLPPGSLLWQNMTDSVIDLGSVTIGAWQGEHSGKEDCIMRYEFAEAYPSRKAIPDYYFVSNETAGSSFCTSKLGISDNTDTQAHESRYGSASAGECKTKLRVKDGGPQLANGVKR